MKNLEVLRTCIRNILQEVIVKINDEDYDIPEDKIDLLRNFIHTDLDIKKFNPDEYLSGMENYPEAASEIQRLMKESYPQDPKTQNLLKKFFHSLYPPEISAILSDRQGPGGVVEVPEALRTLSDTATQLSAGTQIGRGELTLPIMFLGAKLGGSNDPYDATIGGKSWHVKEGKPSVGRKMGSAKGKTFAATPIFKKIVTTGVVDPGELGDIGAEKFANLLPIILSALSATSEAKRIRSISDLYDAISKEVVDASVGDAEGIIWYDSGVYTFTKKSDLGVKYFTQGGRAVLATNAKEQVLKYLAPKPEKKNQKRTAKNTSA